MEDERQAQNRLVAEAVGDRAKQNDGDTASDQPSARDFPEHLFRKSELRLPVAEDGAAKPEAQTGSDQRHEAGEKEGAIVVHREGILGAGGSRSVRRTSHRTTVDRRFPRPNTSF